MQTREHPLRSFELQAVAIRCPECQRFVLLVPAVYGRARVGSLVQAMIIVLATVGMLSDDVAEHRLAAVDGYVPVHLPVVDEARLERCAAAPDREAHWLGRLAEVQDLGS